MLPENRMHENNRYNWSEYIPAYRRLYLLSELTGKIRQSQSEKYTSSTIPLFPQDVGNESFVRQS